MIYLCYQFKNADTNNERINLNAFTTIEAASDFVDRQTPDENGRYILGVGELLESESYFTGNEKVV